jgi:hypothetical protein
MRCLLAALVACAALASAAAAQSTAVLDVPVDAYELAKVVGPFQDRSLSSGQVRSLYLELLANVPFVKERLLNEFVNPNCTAVVTDEQTCVLARALFEYRALVRRYTRSRGSALSEVVLDVRDWLKYGDYSFESLLQRARRKRADFSQGDACQAVLDSASKTSPLFNQAARYL